uniref:GDS1 winged helix domain-containing protein n=1 Tax=Bionectria ochroleuca TaxID=29856 RepID=A0A8H7NFA2_BIOOC
MKRSCWSALTPCPLAKELETVHPRRTYYFLTTFPRQALPESGSLPGIDMPAVVTPSVSLTDDTGSDDVDARRRQLSPSPEIDLPLLTLTRRMTTNCLLLPVHPSPSTTLAT